ncbi:Fluoroacetate dehalogenase [Thiomonas sp. X19]|uniref:alpha/beta fold hydrolase n=1 Tax=Thiomonas sp. X19 TaxID=1050370 RepID=UPI000B6CD124|nr:Fluoroacetate dehalogenase [Thiomonas sp. X19]
MFKNFHPIRIQTGSSSIAGRIGGSGPPLLLLHGHPQTHMIWHKIADALTAHYTVVATDLRGYGASSKPQGQADHSTYSKRAMAADQVAVMQSLGFESFFICAHDRGARVAHRLCLDSPAAIRKAILLDIAPTLAMYEQTNRAFATAYFHWFFLIQPYPFPEKLISSDPDAYIDAVMGNRSAGMTPFTPEAQGAYRSALRSEGAVHAMCEDYRASATIDLDHDRWDRQQGRRVTCPLHVLWGQQGIVGRLFDPLREWGQVAEQVSGHALDCGHYIPEEAPDALLQEIHATLC